MSLQFSGLTAQTVIGFSNQAPLLPGHRDWLSWPKNPATANDMKGDGC